MAFSVDVIEIAIETAGVKVVQSFKTSPVFRQSTRYLTVEGAEAVSPSRKYAVAVKDVLSLYSSFGMFMYASISVSV